MDRTPLEAHAHQKGAPDTTRAMSDLPAEVLRQIFACLSSTERVSLRQVSVAWRDLVDQDITAVAPAELHASTLQRWTALQTLDLSRASLQEAEDWATLLQILHGRSLQTLVLPSLSYDAIHRIPADFSWDAGDLSVQRILMSRDLVHLAPQLIDCIGGLQALSVHLTMPGQFDAFSSLQGQLTCLVLQGGSLRDHWGTIASLRLKHLHLQNCTERPRDILTKVANMQPTLQHLAVFADGHFEAEACEPECFGLLSKLQQLTHLCLRDMDQLRDEGLETLSALTGLQGLDVSHSSISSRGLSPLSSLCNLRDLAIAGTHITVPSALAKVLQQHSQLTRLDISLCRGKLTADNVQPLLMHLQQLAHLNLSGCVIDDSLQCFGSLGRLSSLDLNSVVLDSAWPYMGAPEWEAEMVTAFRVRLQDGLAGLTSLRRLALPNVAVYPEHLPCLGALRALQELNIAGCKGLNLGDGPACAQLFAGLTNLTALQVSLHAEGFRYSYEPSEQAGFRMSLYQHMPASLMALVALPLEALRIWQSAFPFKPAPYGTANQWHQMTAHTLPDRFDEYTAENGLAFKFPATLRRAMVRASTLYQEPAADFKFERLQAHSFLELQV